MQYSNFFICVLVVGVGCQWIPIEKDPDSPCYKFTCPFGQRCTTINNQPLCKCNHNCAKSEKTGPVCTKTGQTYPSLCELKKAECEKKDFILIDYYGNCTNVVKCYDSPREKRMGLCRDWEKHGACFKHVSLMKRFCRETCNMCDVPLEPADCIQSRYGCCPGTNIQALGPRSKGCFKGCRDGVTCPFFPNFCGNKENEETMKKYCPFTCRYCVPEGNNRVEILTEDSL